MKRATSVALLLLLISMLASGCGGKPQNVQQTLRKGKVERGSIDQVVSATGAVFPEERLNLSFKQIGIVTDVYVEVGDEVKAGDRLARINGEALDLALRQAELGLQAQKLSYDSLFAPPSKAAIAGAQAAVASALAGFNKAAAPPDAQQLQIAQLQFEQAYEAYTKADIELRAHQWYAAPGIADQYRAQLGLAINNLETARLRLEQLQTPPDKNALAAASASVAQAQSQLNGLRQGPSDVDIAGAQTRINKAQVALDRARQAQDEATLVAPFSGVVTVVNVTPGVLAPTSFPAVVIIDRSHLHVEVNVDEIDIAKIVVGQPVTVEFDALPSKSVKGQLTKIASSATNTAGVVTYSARIDMAPTDLLIRPGMTATANIVVQQLNDVLVVPNWAIRFDRSTGQAYVSILRDDGKLQDVPVILGLRSSTASQVVAGVKEGQIVAVSLSPDELNLFGGGGGGSQGGANNGGQ